MTITTPLVETLQLLKAAGFPMRKIDPKGLEYFLNTEKRTPEQILRIYTRAMPEQES